ncbi:MAG TPA: MATE family efflux transporter [Firmicutes bacterium]|jgi:putative MATE family efflux protein|nr:MATE family efflux transporter [Bacillota bacterium]
MKKTPANKLGNQSIGKLLFDMAYPAIVAQLVNVLYNVVDRIYIGHIPGIGAEALTGVGITLPLIMAITAFSSLISMGGAPMACIRMGRGEPEEAEKILGNCLVALVVLAAALTATLLIFGKSLLMFFGASQYTIGFALGFLRIYACGTLFVQLALGLNVFITAQGFAKIGMLTVLSGALFSIILDPLFIFAFGMGVKGAALANVIAQAVSAAWVVHFLTGKKTLLKIRRKYLKNDFKVLLPCMALGLSPFIMQLTECLLVIAFNSSLHKYGSDLAVGAMTILSSIMQINTLPITGLTQGANPIISFNYGAGNPARVKKTFLLLFKVSLAYSFGLWLVTMVFPQVFIQLFTNDPKLLHFTVRALRIYMAASLLLGMQIICQQTFIALGNAKNSIFLALLRKVFLLIPLIYILPLFLADKITAIFLAEPLADLLAVTVTGITFAVEFRKTLKKLKPIPVENSNLDIKANPSCIK